MVGIYTSMQTYTSKMHFHYNYNICAHIPIVYTVHVYIALNGRSILVHT